MTIQNLSARPLLGFQIIENPDQPTIPILALKTVEGVTAYMVRKDILIGMAETMMHAAKGTPDKAAQN